MPPTNSQQPTTYQVSSSISQNEVKKKSSKPLFALLILGVLFLCCIFALLLGYLGLKSTNSPILDNLKTALGLSTLKQVITQALDSGYLNNLENQYTSKNSTAQINLAMKSSMFGADINVNSKIISDLKNKLSNAEEKIGGKVSLGGLFNLDLGDGVLVSMFTNENNQEAYYKYSLSDNLSSGIAKYLTAFSSSTAASNLPDKYIKVTKDDLQKTAENNSSLDLNNLQQNTQISQDAMNELKSVVLDYEKYSTITQSSQNGVTIYIFKIDSTKLSERIMQDKSNILDLLSKVDKNISEKSVSDFITFIKYISFDKFELGMKNGYLSQTNVSLVVNKDGLNFLNAMQSNSSSASNLTELTLNANSNYDYSNSPANITLPNDFYTFDEWNKKQQSVVDSQMCIAGGNYDSSTKSCVKTVQEGDLCYKYDGYTTEARCSSGLTCDAGKYGVTSGGYSGNCVKTNSSTSSNQSNRDCESGYTLNDGICYKYVGVGEQCKFDGANSLACTNGNICKLNSNVVLTGGGYTGTCAAKSDCNSAKIYNDYCISK